MYILLDVPLVPKFVFVDVHSMIHIGKLSSKTTRLHHNPVRTPQWRIPLPVEPELEEFRTCLPDRYNASLTRTGEIKAVVIKIVIK